MTKSKKRRAAKPFAGKGRPNHPDWCKQVAARLNVAVDGELYAAIGARTGSNFETVRRYMHTGRFPARFLGAFCLAFEVEPRWLLYGEGRMRARSRRR